MCHCGAVLPVGNIETACFQSSLKHTAQLIMCHCGAVLPVGNKEAACIQSSLKHTAQLIQKSSAYSRRPRPMEEEGTEKDKKVEIILDYLEFSTNFFADFYYIQLINILLFTLFSINSFFRGILISVIIIGPGPRSCHGWILPHFYVNWIKNQLTPTKKFI